MSIIVTPLALLTYLIPLVILFGIIYFAVYLAVKRALGESKK